MDIDPVEQFATLIVLVDGIQLQLVGLNHLMQANATVYTERERIAVQQASEALVEVQESIRAGQAQRKREGI